MIRPELAEPWLNLGCGPYRARRPWVNLDTVANAVIHPDVVVDPHAPLPYDDDSVGRVYCGHMLEHMPWGEPLFELLRDIRRILRPGGELAVVVPDVPLTLELWRQGRVGSELVVAVLEDDVHYQAGKGDVEEWEEARHHWNASDVRVGRALTTAGFPEVEVLGPPTPDTFPSWPVVAWVAWQSACIARA